MEGVPDGGPRCLSPPHRHSNPFQGPQALHLLYWQHEEQMGECIQEHQGEAGGRVRSAAPSKHSSLQEVWGWCSSTCRSPAYSGELARLPGVHLQEDHPLRRLFTNVGIRSALTSPHYLPQIARAHSPGAQVQALSVGLCMSPSSSIFLLQDECPPGLPGKGAKIIWKLYDFVRCN